MLIGVLAPLAVGGQVLRTQTLFGFEVRKHDEIRKSGLPNNVESCKIAKLLHMKEFSATNCFTLLGSLPFLTLEGDLIS